MAYKIKDEYSSVKFVVDTVAEIKTLPTDIAMGSTAYVIEDGSHHILNGNKEWVEMLDDDGEGP